MFIKDILFPKFCLSCGFLGSYICLKCQRQLSRVKRQSCIYCRKHSFLGLTHPGCRRTRGIDGALFVFYYNNTLKKIIKNIKYRFVKEAFFELLDVAHPMIAEEIISYKKLGLRPYIEPIPLHKSKLNYRGFNQAEYIGTILSSSLEFPPSEFLERVRNTLPQAQIHDKRLRYQNLRGAFNIKSGVSTGGKTVLLVDDVVTTGSTVKEAARILKKNKAEKVFVFALAKG